MPHLTPETLEKVFLALSAFLEDAEAPAEELVVVGGSALLALGLVSRTTRDVDILADVDPVKGLIDPRPISDTLKHAAQKVAEELLLPADWLNTGPADQIQAGLPEGFAERLTRREYGSRLTVYFPDRTDLIHLKLFAVVDQGAGRHSRDLMALQPSDAEMLRAARWVLSQDASDVFPQIVQTTLKALGYEQVSTQL
jgi:hypothetical protein